MNAPDYAMTVPYDVTNLPRLSLLKAKIMKRTKLRWCWFEEAMKDDKEAGTSLGTLRYLPYEIRQHIFKIVLECYFDEYNRQYELENILRFGKGYRFVGILTKGKLDFEGRFCRCGQNEGPKFCSVFDLGSYKPIFQDTGNAPLSLRLASSSMKPEFERVFLACINFKFACPASLERFLDQLSSYQQRQLMALTIHPFRDCNCCPDPRKLCEHWSVVCQRLPTQLRAVDFGFFIDRRGLREFWMRSRPLRRLKKAQAISLTVDMFGSLSRQVWRASPRAKISMTGEEKFCKKDRDALGAVLHELEPWSKEWHDWKDGGG